MNTSASNHGHLATQSLPSSATSPRKSDACIHGGTKLEADPIHEWMNSGILLDFDPIWITMQIGRTSDGTEFVHVNDGMCLLIARGLAEAEGFELRPLPHWVYQFEQSPSVFWEEAVDEWHPNVAFEGINVSAGVDISGRRFVYVALKADMHLVLREPDAYRIDKTLDRKVKAVLRRDAAWMARKSGAANE
jgi:hypothetical protein